MIVSEELIKEFEKLELDVCTPELMKEKAYVMTFQPELLEKVKRYQEETMNGNKDKLTSEEKCGQKDDKGVIRNLKRIWIPNVSELKNEILHDAHNSRYSIHPGSTKMYQDLKKNFWWPNIKKEIAEWVSRCDTCQRVKAEHQRPSGLLQPLEIVEWKWEHIAMDFMVGLPRTKANHDAIWIIIDRLTKSAHFLPINEKFSLERLVQHYLKEIVVQHGVPVSIVSDRDPRFNFKILEKISRTFGY